MTITIPDRYVVVDVETTGRASWDRITEVGAIRYEAGKETGRYTSLCNAGHKIPADVTEITGITEAMRLDAPDICEVIEALAAFVGDDCVVGYNLPFDARFLDAAYRKHLGRPLDNSQIDVLTWVRRISDPGDRCRLCDAAERLGIEHHDAHRAIGDCEATQGVLLAALERLRDVYGAKVVIVPVTDYKPAAEPVDWMTATREMLTKVRAACGLADGQLRLDRNDNDKSTTYSITIAEREYPEEPAGDETIYKVVTITPGVVKAEPEWLGLTTRDTQYAETERWLPKKYKRMASGELRLDKDDPALIPYLRAQAVYCLRHYASRASSYSCCSRYAACSNAGRCVHDNRLYGMACQYNRVNLMAGRIFYGVNRCISDSGANVSFELAGTSYTAEDRFPGAPPADAHGKAIRRALGLPITKQLIYYTDSKDKGSAVDIDVYQVIKVYNVTDTWTTVRVRTVDGGVYMIQSAHLADMQRPTFVDDMQRLENQ